MSSSQKFQNDGYCVGGRHKTGTTNIVGEIRNNKKTGKDIKLLVGQCVVCNRKKSMIVSDNVNQAEGLGDFFKNLGKKGLNVSKKMAKNVLKNPGRALEIGANVGTAFASRNPKAALTSLPEVINFYHNGKGLYLPRFT